MNRLAKLSVILTVLCLGAIVAAAIAQNDEKVKFVDSAKAEFKPAPAPGASFAVVWGDMETGPFGAFVKFEPGAKFESHSHSSQLRLAVIKGAYIYKGADGLEQRVGPGSFLTTPAGDHHTSGGDKKNGALFYMESNGKFDLVPDAK